MPARFVLSDLRRALGNGIVAERIGSVPENGWRGVITDTRAMGVERFPSEIFVALDGARYRGWDFVVPAVERGARLLIVGHGFLTGRPEARVVERKASLIEVLDTRAALGALAADWRGRLRARVAAVTGSSGKTTVKEMAACILSTYARTHRSPSSFNNEVGVPLTLLSLEESHDFLVQEMGMNCAGEIARLCGIAKPDYGVITNIGRAHLGCFESIDAIARAKGELFDFLRESGGVRVVNRDDPRLSPWSGTDEGMAVTYGSRDANLIWKRLASDGWTTRLGMTGPSGVSFEAAIPHPGEFTLHNAAAAAALALAMGASPEAVAAGLAEFHGVPMRFEIGREADETTIVNDSYNANPDSMRASIDAFLRLPIPGHRFLLLGDMHELGEVSRIAHEEIGRFAAERGADDLCAVGEWAGSMADAFRAACGDPTLGLAAADDEEAGDWVARRVQPGDGLLIKGSRASRMERFLTGLSERGR